MAQEPADHSDVAPRPLSQDMASQAATIFKTLADPTRLKMLYLVADRGTAEICAHEISQALKISPPTVTHHMKRLAAAELVRQERRGKGVYFTINPVQFYRIHNLITHL